jgi:nucleoside-diphosphate-sugar epimerase
MQEQPKETAYIVGRRSYVGGVLFEHFAPHFTTRQIGVADLADNPIKDDDVIINCAFAAAWHHEDAPDSGFDGSVAEIARRSGARYVMVSSRAVYAPRLDPPLSEDEPVAPKTIYGKNKAKIEATLQELLGSRLLILRLGNVFGSEPLGRHTFVSTALRSLVREGTIELDIAPTTRKDFVPAWFVGQAAATLVSQGADGIVNIGSGIALPIGEVANALIRGNGTGQVKVLCDDIGEEFCLDVTSLANRTGLTISRHSLVLSLEKAAKEHHG